MRDKREIVEELAEIGENPGGIEGVEGEWEGYSWEDWGVGTTNEIKIEIWVRVNKSE